MTTRRVRLIARSAWMRLVVQKFGGSSLADAAMIHRAARRAIRAKLAGSQVVVVVSAMGHTTDELIGLARQISDRPPSRELDMLLTTGEQVSIALVAMAIHAAGHEAISLTAGQIGLVTDSAHTRARIRSIQAERIRQELDRGRIVIVAGFQGRDVNGEITTLGRGASDTTAVALAAVLEAGACEIYTDVDGVYSSDPRIVPQARKIRRISYDEMHELASLGADVIHPRAIEFGKKYNVPIHVRSSFTDAEGTMIIPGTADMEAIVVRGCTLKRDLARVTLAGVPNRPGTAAGIFSRLADRNIIVDDILQVVHPDMHVVDLSFTIPSADLSDAEAVTQEVMRELELTSVEIDRHVAKVCVVGLGMRSHSGVAARMFRALAEAEVNINGISTSEIMIACLIRADQGEKALQKLHEAFGLAEANNGNPPRT
jgi:aspartate kinase